MTVFESVKVLSCCLFCSVDIRCESPIKAATFEKCCCSVKPWHEFPRSTVRVRGVKMFKILVFREGNADLFMKNVADSLL